MLSFVFSMSGFFLTIITLIYWIKINNVLLCYLMIDSCGFGHCKQPAQKMRLEPLATVYAIQRLTIDMNSKEPVWINPYLDY